MTGEAVSIQLEPSPSSVAMSRIFVAAVLSAAGVEETIVDDARVFISDLATALVSEGAAVQIEARFGNGEVRVEGNLPGLLPEAGSLLLGDSLGMSEGRWILTVPTG
ncbi:MAG TPA: hypothetical protein VF246_06185 [Acidimicrobiia bacterium]